MLRFKRAHRWIAVAGAALLSCSYLMDVSAAIAPPKPGTCKPVDEPPADGKEKVTNPTQGNKGQTPAAGPKPGKQT